MPHLLFLGFLAGTATVFALLEVQIEGKAGWASGLPTWRVENRWTRLLLGRRAVTGYHLYSHLFVLLLLHLPYALYLVVPGWRYEARIIAFGLFLWIAEDFCWFVLNPAYGLRAFRPEHAWWHAASWWWIMPRDYWLFLGVGILLYLFSWR